MATTSTSPSKGAWQAPGASDLRSPCPILNSLANHGLIPRDGRNITAPELTSALSFLGLNSTISNFLTGVAFKVHSDQGFRHAPKGTSPDGLRDADSIDPATGTPILSLEQVGRPNAIEHDVSITRQDREIGDCINVDPELFDNFIHYRSPSSHADPRTVGPQSAGRYRKVRYDEQKAANAQLKFSVKDHVLASMEIGAICCVFGEGWGARVPKRYIRAVFRDERLPFEEGWEPRSRWRVGVLEVLAVVVVVAWLAWPF